MDIKFLKKEQIVGEEKLGIFNKLGISAAMTDFSILLGGNVSNYSFTKEGTDLRYRTGWYWMETGDEENDIFVVTSRGSVHISDSRYRNYGARLVIPYSLISNTSYNKLRRKDDVLEVECGEYPQWAVSHEYQMLLEKLFRNGDIVQSTNYITTDSRRNDEYITEFKPQKHNIYEYNGKKYIRVVVNLCDTFKLSNGEEYGTYDVVWVEISPIKWVIDEEKNIALSKNLVFSGVQFNIERDYKGDFYKADIKKFIDTYFVKDIKIITDNEQDKVANTELTMLSHKNNKVMARILVKN